MSLGQTARSSTVSAYISIYATRRGRGMTCLLVTVVAIAGSYTVDTAANVFFTTALSILVGLAERHNSEYQTLLANRRVHI